MGYAPAYDTEYPTIQPEWTLCGLDVKIGKYGSAALDTKTANNNAQDTVGLGAMRSIWCHQEPANNPMVTKTLYDENDMPGEVWQNLMCPNGKYVNGILVKEGPASDTATFDFVGANGGHEDLFAIGGIKIRCVDYYNYEEVPTEVESTSLVGGAWQSDYVALSNPEFFISGI